MGLTPSSLLRGLVNAKHPHLVLPQNQRGFHWPIPFTKKACRPATLELLLGRTVTLKVLEDNQATILVVRKGYPLSLGISLAPIRLICPGYPKSSEKTQPSLNIARPTIRLRTSSPRRCHPKSGPRHCACLASE